MYRELLDERLCTNRHADDRRIEMTVALVLILTVQMLNAHLFLGSGGTVLPSSEAVESVVDCIVAGVCAPSSELVESLVEPLVESLVRSLVESMAVGVGVR